MDQLSFFDLNDRLAQISKIGDPLEVLNEIVDWSKFDGMLEEKGLFARGGSIVDATIVNVPVQRNKADENETIKKGKEPEEWKEQPAKSAQKDVDARWGCKHGTYTFGYKAHVVADNKNKIVRNVIVTAASGYVGSSDPLPEGYREHVCKKGFRGKPLTAFQAKCNAKKSRTRCRIEHVFGWVKGNHELFVRTIGKARAEAKILASFLTYNMFRMAALTRPKWA